MTKSKDTYFTDSMKHRTVEEFAVSYINRAIKIRDFDTRKKLLEVVEFRTYLRQADPANHWLHSHKYIDNIPPDERTINLFLPDQRFKNLNELIGKVSRRIKVPDEERDAIEEELYGLVVMLLEEGRIDGDFKLQPMRDRELERIGNILDRLEKRMTGIENHPVFKAGIQR